MSPRRVFSDSRSSIRGARTAVTIVVASALALAGSASASAAPIVSSPFGSSGSASSESTVSDAARLSSVDNFRDVAGTGAGYVGSFGLHVNRGVFYRSNRLAASDADLAALDALHLTQIYDLRTNKEIASTPDRVPAGAAYSRISVLSGDIAAEIGALTSAEEAVQYMESMNRSFVGDPIARGKIAEVLTDMAENPGPQLFHCTSGKDRTGWISALLLSIAGVPRETIVQDYLLTNEYSTVSIQALIDRFTAAKGPAFAPIITKVAGVERNYLEAGLSELDLEYGSVDRYLVEGLGLSPATILTLKAKLLF